MASTPDTRSPDTGELLAHAGWVRTLAARLVLDPQHVDDVVQDVWQAVLDKPPKTRISLAAWLSGVVRNVAAMGRRSDARRKWRETAAARRDAVPSTVELAERAELQGQLTHLVNQLPEVHRDVVLLRYFEDMPPRKIAQHLGVPVNTVRSRLTRALAKLREELDAEHGDRRSWGLLLLPLIRPLDAAQAGVLAAEASVKLGLAEGARQSSVVKQALLTGAVAATGVGLWLAFSDPGADQPDGVKIVHEQEPSRKPMVDREPILPKTVARIAPPRARFHGRTVDRFGEPVSGQSIAMFRLAPDLLAGATANYSPRQAAEPDFVVGRAQTDGDGKFVIEGHWPQSLFVVTWGRKLRYITHTPTVGLAVDLGDLRVEPTTGLSGRVVDIRGFGVAGVRVQSVNLAKDLLENFPLWQLLDAERVIYAPHANVIPEVADFWRRLLNLSKSPTETAMLLRPRWLESLAELMPFVATQTDADGRFRLDGLSRRGTTTLVVTKAGYEVLVEDKIAVFPLRIRKLSKPLELPPARITRGEVRGSDGNPLVGVEVSVACVAPNGSPFHFAQPTVRTARDGSFEVKGITTSQIYVAVRASPDDAWFIREVGAANPNRLELPRRHRIGFRLVSSHRLPIGSPEVTLVPGHQALARARRGMVEPLVPGDRLTVKEDGHFEIRDVLPGHYTLVVRCTGHATLAKPLHVTRRSEDVLYLEPAARVKIIVRDQNFEPVEGAEVFARSLKPAGPLAGITIACGPTDSNGNVTIDSLVGRSVAITAVHPRHGIAHRVEALTDGAEWFLTLAAPGRIAGRVVSESSSPTSSPRSWTVQMFPVARNRALETAFAFAALNDSNSFARATLAEALYELRAIPDLAGIHPKEDLVSRLQFIGQRTPVVTVNSLAGGWVILATQAQAQEPDPTPEAPPPAPKGLVTLRGTVQLPDGQPAKGATLRLSPTGRDNGARVRTVETDSRGQFQCHDLAEGEYAIEARGHGTGRCRSRVVIADAAVKPITVKLLPGVFVEGRLAKPGKLREIQFILQDRSGNWLDPQGRIARLDQIDALLKELPRARLDAAGRFAKTVLPPGRYCVTPAEAGVVKAAEYNAYVTIGDRDLPGIVIGPLVKRSILWPSWFGGSRKK